MSDRIQGPLRCSGCGENLSHCTCGRFPSEEVIYWKLPDLLPQVDFKKVHGYEWGLERPLDPPDDVPGYEKDGRVTLAVGQTADYICKSDHGGEIHIHWYDDHPEYACGVHWDAFGDVPLTHLLFDALIKDTPRQLRNRLLKINLLFSDPPTEVVL